MDSNMDRKHRSIRGQRGMSLAEVIVTTVIFALIFVVALTLYDRGNKVFKTSVESADMQQNTRAGFDRLVSDVRMAGFDADRDGVPTQAPTGVYQVDTIYAAGVVVAPTIQTGFLYRTVSAGVSANPEPVWPTVSGQTFTSGSITWVTLGPVYQQPDEQIEFAGPSAIVVRANFDYQLDIDNEHGRENAATGTNYEPAGGEFPIVTTANNEIVAYALRSDSGTNGDTLAFYADTTTPRSAYPGGRAEELVRIPNVDLCTSGCNNPPYTLMRFTLGPGTATAGGAPDAGTPVANNIRSLTFSYFNDVSGTVPIAQVGAGGDGQFDPDPSRIGATTNWDDRVQRASVQIVRINLVGMNGRPDANYTNPAEAANSPALHYRTYTLESNVSPRNLGLSGLSEPDTRLPSPPSITSVCVGACRVTRIQWNPSVSGNVDSYEVHYAIGTPDDFSNIGIVVPGDVVSAPVFNLTPGVTYYFKVVAVNDLGKSQIDLSNYLSRAPVNSTRPGPVTALTGTDGASAMANQITLTWTAPSRNDPNLNTMSCQGTVVSGDLIDAAEPIRYRIWRGTTPDFNPMANPSEGEVVLDQRAAAQPNGPGGSVITWTDDFNNVISKPPANCKDYYYRIQVYDTCSLEADPTTNPPYNAASNSPNLVTTGQSEIFPRAVAGGTDPAIHGYASSTTKPNPPTGIAPNDLIRIDYTNGSSTCSGNVCDVRILWPKVIVDTSNPTNQITIDQYRVRRERKKSTDTVWVPDTVLPVLVDASSNSAYMQGNDVVFHDTTAIDKDTNDRRKWYYRYTITALQCGVESDPSTPVQFPENCGLTGTEIVQSGASSGLGTAVAPWVLGSDDFVYLVPPTGIQLNRALYETYPEPDSNPNGLACGTTGASCIDTYLATTGRFEYRWGDQQDGQVYRVVITLTNDQGCTEQVECYIQDEATSCASATVTQTGASSGSGQGTEGLPWIMGRDDTVTVNPPVGVNVISVTFTLHRDAGHSNAVVDGPYILTGTPFTYLWKDQNDNETYRLNIQIDYEGICSEDIDRFITDEPPPVCTGATTTVTGSAGGDGLTQGTPWILNGGDTIEIVPATNGIINQVVFTTTPVSPSGIALPAVSDSTSPYILTWSDQTDNTIYRVDAVITYASGCPETVTRYVKDQLCFGATAAQVGSSGAGTGLTTASPWVFSSGDSVTVTPPTGETITGVQFKLFDEPGTTTLVSSTDTTSPYSFTYADRTDNALYRLEMTVTYSAGCAETITRYIKDEALCFLSATVTSMITLDVGGRAKTTITYQITNPSSEVVTLSGIKVDWLRDAGHPQAILESIVYNGTVTQTVTNQTPVTTGIMTPITPTPATIPANSSSYTIALKYDVGQKNQVTDLLSNWVTGLCLKYTVPSFGGSPASCNVFGSITGNPTSCS